MSRIALCFAALVVAAAAWPSNTFIKVDSYTSNALCAAATTTPQATEYFALDLCTVDDASSGGHSSKWSMADSTQVQKWRFTGTTCATYLSGPSNYTIGGCGATGLSRATVLSTSVGLYSQTSYSDQNCGTVSDGPTFSMQGCYQGVQYTVAGKLTVCSGGSTTDCSGGTCASISHGTCNAQDNNQGSILFDWNGASSATPAVALTAALIAVVAAVTKF